MWDEDALNLVCDAAGGYPYFVQLGGYHAWEPANGQPRIASPDALHAAGAIQTDADRMVRDRWARLGPTQREYLVATAVAQLEQPGRASVPTGEIASRLGKQHSELTRVRSTLINDHHPLRATARGELEFALPRFRTWLQDQIAPAPGAGERAVANPEFTRYVSASRAHPDVREAARLNKVAQPTPPASTRDASTGNGERDQNIQRRQPPRRPSRGR